MIYESFNAKGHRAPGLTCPAPLNRRPTALIMPGLAACFVFPPGRGLSGSG